MIFTVLKRILSKPLSVILFRSKQKLRLILFQRINYWSFLSKRFENIFSTDTTSDISIVLIQSEIPELTNTQLSILRASSLSVLSSDFKVFGHPIPKLETCNFSSDWRFGKTWSPMYYKKYRFYEQKEIAYDVKFPWEISRFHYFIPVFAYQLATGVDAKSINMVFNVLNRWRMENPLAYSVNWYPMEASMRAINFVLLLDFINVFKSKETKKNEVLDDLGQLLKIMIAEHGSFVWLNREFTDVRGNHFTANIVALFIASRALKNKLPVCKKWESYALEYLDKEASLQFLPDGVNFEKSCGYHKLVLELFILAAIAREKCNIPFSKTHENIFAQAAIYSDSITRPDGLAANFGDNDDAVALSFSLGSSRCHGAIVELARAFLNRDLGIVHFPESCRLSAIFLLGKVRGIHVEPRTHEMHYFQSGGYVIVRNQTSGFFFMVDIGEVGMKGRGGHGHNDLLSFELFIDGRPIVIDPGCPGYTADLTKKDLYRSTKSHATIELFDEEIARLNGYWGILNEAQPLNSSVHTIGHVTYIECGHNGYERYASGTKIFRKFRIDPLVQALSITDKIILPSGSTARACWRFPTGDIPIKTISPGSIAIESGLAYLSSPELPLTLVDASFSPGYGEERQGHVAIASLHIKNTNLIHVNFRKQIELINRENECRY